jgi:LacI family transcriptional regulator, galactose operon repressor
MTTQKRKKVNIREVAKAAGTSVASVSRALRDTPSPNLSAVQRARILKVCEKLQYYPNEHTRRMFSKQANTVALYFPPFGPMEDIFESHIIDVNFGACMQGIRETLAENSIQLLLSEVSADFLASKQHLKMIRGKMVDGIIIWGVIQQDNYVQELLNEEIPLVMVQNEKVDCECMKVIADDYGGMLSVVNQILDAGHRKIAVTTPTITSSAGAERLRGIIDGLSNHNLEPVYTTKQRGFGHTFGQLAAQEIMENCPEATCIIASNDMAAWGCIDFAKSRELRVPEDISVAGADGLKIPGEMVISSYFSPSYEMGKLGAKYLLKLISGEKITERICLPTTAIPGNTIKDYHGK